MALVLKDRVKETTTTTGTGTITLSGASSGFQAFSAIGSGNTTYYTIQDTATGAWEVGIGTYSSTGPTLTRDQVLSSSNSGALVSFAAGVKDVFVTVPAYETDLLMQTPDPVMTGLVLGGWSSPITTATAYDSAIITVPAVNIDCATGNYFIKTINTATTFTFSNAPSGRSYSFTLELTQTSGAVTWPGTVVWPNNTAPTLTAGNIHLFTFVTDDAGTKWRGAALPNYPS